MLQTVMLALRNMRIIPIIVVAAFLFSSGAVVVPAQTPDLTPPDVFPTAPQDGSTVSGSAVTVSATASDNVGIAAVQFKLDGTNLGSELSSRPYTISLDTASLVNGSHTITAVARAALPWMMVLLGFLLLVTYWPALTLVLPNLLF